MKRFYPHQVEAFKYSLAQRHPALFMEMRLGKTLVAIRRIKQYGPNIRCLIVAPNSALGSWLDELASEREPGVVWVKGTRQERRALLASEGRWFLVNKEAFLSVPELASERWDCIVLDESTFIKNPKAKVTKYYLANFREVPHRWILTGTPNPQSDMDLYCQMAFLDNRFIGYWDYWKFRSGMFETKWNDYDWSPKQGTMETIARALANRTFILRRKDINAGPRKVYITRKIELDHETAKQYKQIERDFDMELNGTKYSTIWAAVRFTWLRRLCGGFDPEGKRLLDNTKTSELVNLLQGELAKDQVVVWFAFNSEIRHVKDTLKDNKISVASMMGEDSIEQREKVRNWFQRGEVRVMLIQQAVAQTGINLSAADTAIYFSPPLGRLALSQTEDRILSLSKRAPLLYIRLACTDTVDLDIWDTLAAGGMTSEVLISKAIRERIHRRVQ